MIVSTKDDAVIIDPKSRNDKLWDAGVKTKYFQNREHELAFYFSFGSSTSLFDSLLGIKPIHKADVKKARALRSFYLKKFHPDKHIDDESENDFTYKEVSEDIIATFKRVSGGKL